MKLAYEPKVLLFCTTVLVSALGFSDSGAQAQQTCESFSGSVEPRIGTACVERVYIRSGKANWPDGRESNTEEYVPPNRHWIITYVSPLVATSAQQSKASRQLVADGQLSSITREIDNTHKRCLETYNKLRSEAKFPIQGVPVEVGGITENVEKRCNELKDTQRYLSNVSSNIGQVILRAEAWGECKWRDPLLRICGDGTGGWYEGYVDVTRVYVGDVAAFERRIMTEAERGLELVRQGVGREKRIYILNQCKFPIRLVLRYIIPPVLWSGSTEEWLSYGWWNMEANRRYLAPPSVWIKSSIVYFYAEITQEPLTDYRWSGNNEIEFDGRKLRMREERLIQNSDGDSVLQITCSNL